MPHLTTMSPSRRHRDRIPGGRTNPLPCTCPHRNSDARACAEAIGADDWLKLGYGCPFGCHPPGSAVFQPAAVPGATEDDIQRAIIRFLESVTDSDQVIAFHIPNGGARSKPGAAIMKGLGVLAGAADIFIGWTRGSRNNNRPYFGFLEVKTDAGRLTDHLDWVLSEGRLVLLKGSA